ncbi:hypothetical protein F5Y07DRAFT_312596 [Xylaria sp. FL0933]|nr:hypothetical protein F5Y07DRAFT_312596 [Xylaria sp. FL0933]
MPEWPGNAWVQQWSLNRQILAPMIALARPLKTLSCLPLSSLVVPARPCRLGRPWALVLAPAPDTRCLQPFRFVQFTASTSIAYLPSAVPARTPPPATSDRQISTSECPQLPRRYRLSLVGAVCSPAVPFWPVLFGIYDCLRETTLRSVLV